VAGATARVAKETRQARADARVVPESVGPAQARDGVRAAARAETARADRPAN
jgi:hypothetical protein